MTVPTNLRVAQKGAFFAGFQTALGTAVTDFTAATAKNFMTEVVPVWASPEPEVERFMGADLGPDDGAVWVHPDEPVGVVELKGTPTSLEWLLKSNFGTYAAGAFTLATGVSATRWLTLAWVEDRALGTASTLYLIRHRDSWFHRVALEWTPTQRHLRLLGSYAGRKVLTQLLNAGGITLPAVPMTVADKSVFPSENTTLVRDPAGANVALRWSDMKLTLDQGLGQEWDMAAGLTDVYKKGPLTATLEFTSQWSDETHAILALTRANTKAQYRITSTCENGKVLTINLYGVTMKMSHPGHEGQKYAECKLSGIATNVAGNITGITLA